MRPAGLFSIIQLSNSRANAIAGEKEKYLAAGFVDYLSKPVRGKELEKMVMKYLPQKLIK